MATISKLPSGSYRIRKNYNGKTYSMTVNYKPKKNEADQLIAQLISRDPVKVGRLTFEGAARAYISGRSNVLSPATIRGYEQILRTLPPALLMHQLRSIDGDDLQRLVNDLVVDHSPKTVRNIHGFVVAVIKHKRPDFVVTTKLPNKEREEFYVPQSDDVRRILAAAYDTDYYVPLCLAAYGLRRSEVLALTLEDVGDGEITISKALVQGADGEWHVKSTKTALSTRTIQVDRAITDRIHAQGYVTHVTQSGILRRLHKLQDELGIPRFALHKLRHFFATEAISNGISPIYVAALGGWKPGTKVMEKVYTHLREERLREDGAKIIRIIGVPESAAT